MSKPVLELTLTRTARSRTGVNLGRTTVYGPSIDKLRQDFNTVGEAIDRCSRAHLTLARVVLAKLVRDDLQVSIFDKRLFGALLGRQLRLGRLDTVLCESTGGKTFRVIVNPHRLSDFQRSVQAADKMLLRDRVVSIKELESVLFPSRSYGTRSSAAHIGAHLVYFGRAQYEEEDIVSRPEGLDDALRATE